MTSQLQFSMLDEVRDRGIEAAGDVWPTDSMALSRLFERGATFLDSGGTLPPIKGNAPPELLETLNVSRGDLFLVEALHLLTRHVTFMFTRNGDALEKVWLGLADRHLEIRA